MTAKVTPAQRACPVCDSPAIDDAGITLHPQPTRVAGVPIDLSGVEFHIRRCRTCSFQFKDPTIAQEVLLECYAKVDTAYYGFNPPPERRRFDQLKAMISRHAAGRRILDVGCFNGAFLRYMGDSWDRFGVEPCTPAAKVAADRGVHIFGDTVESIPAGTLFDVITAIDVVEHIVAPMPFFNKLASMLAPGGILLIVTGDSDAARWRRQGPLYWYVIIPEHVGFFNQRSVSEVAKRVGLTPAEHIRTSHTRETPREAIRQWAKNTAYSLARATNGLGVSKIRRAVSSRGAPGWMASPDHMFSVVKRD